MDAMVKSDTIDVAAQTHIELSDVAAQTHTDSWTVETLLAVSGIFKFFCSSVSHFVRDVVEIFYIFYCFVQCVRWQRGSVNCFMRL